jgi:hypothetical protein
VYDELLENTAVPSGHRQYYEKWLHFNLDFCRTFRLEAKKKNSILESSRKRTGFFWGCPNSDPPALGVYKGEKSYSPFDHRGKTNFFRVI